MNTVLEMPVDPRSDRQLSGKLQTARPSGLCGLFAIFAIVLFLLAPAMVRGQGITGSITGTVSDSSGAVVSGATVTVRQVETNALRSTTTSDAGTTRSPSCRQDTTE